MNHASENSVKRDRLGLPILFVLWGGLLSLFCIRDDLTWTDSSWYHLMATHMAEGHGVWFHLGDTQVPAAYLPGYPMVLAVLYKLFGPHVWLGGFLSTLCFLGTVGLMLKTCSELGNRSTGWLSAAIVMWTLPLATISSSIMSEGLSSLVWAMGFLLLSRDGRGASSSIWLLAVLSGLSMLVRPNGVLMAPCVLLALSLRPQDRLGRLVKFSLAFLPFLLLMFLWNQCTTGNPLRVAHASYYHDWFPLSSWRYALPFLHAQSMDGLMGNFLAIGVLFFSGWAPGELLFPAGLLFSCSFSHWVKQKMLPLLAPFLLCVGLHWALFSPYFYFSARLLLPAYLALILLSQPALDRILSWASGQGALLWRRDLFIAILFLPLMIHGSMSGWKARGQGAQQRQVYESMARETEPDAIIVSGYQVLVETVAHRTSLTFWEACNPSGRIAPILLSGRPVYAQMGWYARNMEGSRIVNVLKREFEIQEVDETLALFRLVPKQHPS